jgi:hypothetical protein
MENSKKYLSDRGILPKISFNKNEPRIVQIIDDKPETIKDKEGKEVEGMKYKVVENGEAKTIFTSSVTLISKLAEIDSEETVKITQKGYQQDGDWRTTYEVVKIKDGKEEEVDDIPVIEE